MASATGRGQASQRSVCVLSTDAIPPGGAGPLRVDLLSASGWSVVQNDAHRRRPADSLLHRALRPVERRTVPFLQLAANRRSRRATDATLAFFESEAHSLAMLRTLRPRRFRGKPLVVMSCWLSDIAATSPGRRRLYRILYRGVDHVTVFASNQVATLRDELRIPADRMSVVRLGVERAFGDPPGLPPSQRSTPVLAVGRDAGRDWASLCAAARIGGWPATIITRQHLVDGIEVPPNVNVLGPVSREEYQQRLRAARVVVVPTSVRTYPTGQSVLLEAMMAGCAVVVSTSPALADYIEPDVDCIGVPPADPHALAAAIDELMRNDALADRLGAAAAARAADVFTADRMWESIADVLESVVVSARSKDVRR